MRLEKSIPREKLHQDTPDAPDVAGEAPSEIQYDLGRSIVSRRHHRGMILVVKRSRSEVDQSDFRIEQNSPLSCTTLLADGRTRDLTIIRKGLVVVSNKEDVFRLQVGVN